VERFRFLDVLRGIAVLGILPVNIAFFALPWSDPSTPNGTVGTIVHVFTETFFTFKFISIFSFLFGIGIALMRQRAAASGASFTARIVRRLLFLLLFGALHIALFWYGDILFIYAVLGLLLFGCSAWSPKALVISAAILIALPVLSDLMDASNESMTAAIEAERESFANIDPAEMHAAATGTDAEFAAALHTSHPAFETAVYRNNDLARQFSLRIATFQTLAVKFTFSLIPLIAGLFLLGMAAAKTEWILRPSENQRRFARLATWSLLIGLPLQLLLALNKPLDGSDTRLELTLDAATYISALVVAAGYVGLVGAFSAKPTIAHLTTPFAAVGRTAFSNYMLQSFVCTLLFYGWGLGLFGSASRLQLIGVVIGVWSLNVGFATVWLRYRSMGPLEWIWRKLTYGFAATSR